MRRLQRIAQVGTFDVENYGDLLYPLLLKSLLVEHERDVDVHVYAPTARTAPLMAGFKTEAVRDLFNDDQPVKVIIGGGDLLRTDTDVVAAHYESSSRASFSALNRSLGLAGTAGYVARSKLPGLRPTQFYVDRFRERWISYSAPAPFVLDPRWLPPGSAISYLSCGVPHPFSVPESEQLLHAIDQAQFIYVRDHQSSDKLKNAGVSKNIFVAPDLAVLLSAYFNADGFSSKGKQIFREVGVETSRPIVCFQSQPFPSFDERQIVSALDSYRQKARAEIVLLPLGLCHGDKCFLERIAQLSGFDFKLLHAQTVAEVIAIISACDVFVGTSLHGNITAFSYGIPHVFGPLPVDKNEGFLQAVELPTSCKLTTWAELDDALEAARSLGREYFVERAVRAKKRTKAVVKELIEGLLA